MIVKDSFHYATSHRDLHFTDNIIPQGSEYEDIRVTQAGDPMKCHITSVVLQTATLHNWTLSFWDSSVLTLGSAYTLLTATPFKAANLLGAVHLDTSMSWATATTYVYSTSFAPIHYLDTNAQGQLHVGLHNRDTKTKLAPSDSSFPSVATQYVHLRVGMIGAA